VVPANDFWLQLHRLAEAYKGEGPTTAARAANIIAQLRDLPPTARRAVLADFAAVAVGLHDLYPVVVGAGYEPESMDRAKAKGGVA